MEHPPIKYSLTLPFDGDTTEVRLGEGSFKVFTGEITKQSTQESVRSLLFIRTLSPKEVGKLTGELHPGDRVTAAVLFKTLASARVVADRLNALVSAWSDGERLKEQSVEG